MGTLEETDAEIERILAMTPEECRLAGIAEFGSEEAWLEAMEELSSYRDGRVWARFSRGDTAAAAEARDLCFGVRPLDGDLTRGERASR